MGVLSDLNTYYKWLTTTKMSMEEISTIISQCEKGMGSPNWEVRIHGKFRNVGPVDLVLRQHLNGNGGNGNGHVGQPQRDSGATDTASLFR